MRIVFLIALALALALLSACRSSATDADVLNVTLSDFVLSTEHCRESLADDRVRVDATTLQAGSMTTDAQVRGEIGEERWNSVAPLLATLRKRSAAALPLAWWPSASFDVTVTDLSAIEPESKFMEKYAQTRCHLRFWLPAFSEDRRLALVRFSWGPSAHGATATYLVERSDDGWRVLWRRIAIYA